MEALRALVQRAQESLFFVPALVVVVCLGLAWASVLADSGGGVDIGASFLLSATVSGGRVIATAVAGATITVAAIVFSITALSSQIASTQYSPRAVAGFFEDRFQQIVIGFVVGTFAYSLLVLAELGGTAGDDAAVASVSVTGTVVLGIASVVTIIAYLDHSLRRMRISAVVRRIAHATVMAVDAEDRGKGEVLEARPQSDGEPVAVRVSRTGWVRSIDASKLARSLPARAMARVEVRVGEAVAPGDRLATVWRADSSGRDGDVKRRVREAVHIGRDRSIRRDPAYGLRQLVDIGLRALSPGINDPTTATDVLQHLKVPLREIMIRDAPRRVYGGSREQRVFLPEAPSRSDHVHMAFAEIRLSAAHQPSVLRTIIDVIADLILELEAADNEARTGALRTEVDLAVAAAKRAGFPEEDLDRVLGAAKRLSNGSE